MNTNEFGALLNKIGIDSFSGVPCSYLAPLINYAINQDKFIMAANEGEAIAIASGISLANLKENLNNRKYGAVLMQNSGLSNALSPLTSLNYTFSIPILGFVSLRGERDINNKNTDEPQHELLGVITDKLLEVCNIEYDFLSSDFDIAKKQLFRAKEILEQNKSFFFIVKNNVFEKVKLESNKNENLNKNSLPTRLEALEIIQKLALESNAILLATTGKTGRELYEINDSNNQLYMVGSMGCVSSLALGISLYTDKKVIAVDGDSALLMRLGNLAANNFYAKGNLIHILLDNESHDSTGGQFNLSAFVDFCKIAKSCGSKEVFNTNNLDEFKKALKKSLDSSNSSFIYLKIKKGSKQNLGRPKVTPKFAAERLANFIKGDL